MDFLIPRCTENRSVTIEKVKLARHNSLPYNCFDSASKNGKVLPSVCSILIEMETIHRGMELYCHQQIVAPIQRCHKIFPKLDFA